MEESSRGGSRKWLRRGDQRGKKVRKPMKRGKVNHLWSGLNGVTGGGDEGPGGRGIVYRLDSHAGKYDTG